MPTLSPDTNELLVTGRGRYVADLAPEGCVDACFVRATVADAAIAAIHLGTEDGITGATLGLRPISLEAGGMITVDWQPMAIERVRYVGEPVAITWAGDRYTAEDRAAAAVVEFRPYPVGTPIHPAAPDGVLFSRSFDSGGVDEAMGRAHHVLEQTFRPARQSAVPIEGRGVLATHDGARGVTTVWTSTQLPHLVRGGIAHALGAEPESIRVVVPHVGGGFGLKANLYAEEIAVAALARRLGRPVRWIEDRTENLVASTQAHDTRVSLHVGVDGDGRVLAFDADVEADIGAYPVWPATPLPEAAVAAMSLFGPYRYGAVRLRTRAVASHKCPVGPCRGIGQTAAVFATERMMDLVAGALGIDPLEVRRRNAVREMPWRSPSGRRLDSGDYLALLDLLEPGYTRLRRDQAAARADGRMFGVGIGLFNEISASGSADYRQRGVTSIPGTDGARVVVTPERRIEIYTSAADAGQGHAETYRALAEQELGIPPDQVDVIEGDTTSCPDGSGTFISRGAVGVVACVVEALREAAKRDLEPGTDVTHVHDPSQVYPAGAHLAAVEVDPVGLVAKVVRYIAVEDCGRLIHPEIVDGQIRGGIAMGIGQVLLEEHTYSDDGQPQTTTLRDYLLPLATDVPPVEIHHIESPSPETALGSKGVGEAGTIGAFGAVANAVADALGPLGTALTDLPYSPERIFTAMLGQPPD